MFTPGQVAVYSHQSAEGPPPPATDTQRARLRRRSWGAEPRTIGRAMNLAYVRST